MYEHSTKREYFDDTYKDKSSGKILDILAPETDEEKEKKLQYIVLDKTIMHPQGGGQPGDIGSLQSADGKVKFTITDYKVKDNAILHIGNFESGTFKVGDNVNMSLDLEFRRTHARIHSAGHLLDMAMNRAGKKDLKPTKGYHFEAGPYVEYQGNVPEKERDTLAKELEKHCNDLIAEAKAANTQVFRKMCSYDEAQTQLKEAGGVPAYCPAGKELRVLKLTPEDLGCPCGGTHVHSIAEIGSVSIGKMKKKKANLQVSYKVLADGAAPPKAAAPVEAAGGKDKKQKGGDKGADKAPKGGKQEGGKKAQDKPQASGSIDIKDVKSIEEALGRAQYLTGEAPTAVDKDAYNHIVNNVPEIRSGSYPNTFAWFFLMMHFQESVRNSWPAAGAGDKKGGKGGAKGGKKKEVKKDDDDDLDLFGDDDEDDIAAAKAAAEAAKGKKKKEKPPEMSLIIFEVKPLDDTTSLDDMAKRIFAMKQDGLIWKTGDYKKIPVAFGIFKLIIGMSLEDSKVSVDDIQEKIEAMDDMVQSVEIASFTKI